MFRHASIRDAWKYNSMHSLSLDQIGVSRRLHKLANLSWRKYSPVYNTQDDGWDSQPTRTLYSRVKYVTPAGNKTFVVVRFAFWSLLQLSYPGFSNYTYTLQNFNIWILIFD